MMTHSSARKTRRIPLDCAVYYTNGRFHASGTVDNMSSVGGCVQGTEPVCPGMQLKLVMVPMGHDGAVIVRQASVRWSTGTAFGLEWADLSLESQMRLSRLVNTERPEIVAS
ncbi:MAG: PilZ domain-containing protein [Nitrospiraceae bacterium]